MTKIRHKAKVAKQLPVLMSGFAQFRSYDSYLSHLNPMILCVKNVTLKQDLERCFFSLSLPNANPLPAQRVTQKGLPVHVRPLNLFSA